MNFKGNNKVQTNMETVLVATTNSTPVGSLVNATTALNIGNGELGVLSYDLDGLPVAGDFLTLAGAPTSTNVAVKLIQGTPKSSATHTVDPWEVGAPGTVDSNIINFGSILDYGKRPASFGQLSMSCVHTVGAVTAGRTYSTEIYLNSVKGDRDYGDNDEVIYESVDTGLDLSVYTDATDYVLQNLIHKFNLRSKLASVSNSAGLRRGNKDYIVLGINKAGATGTVLNTLAQGASVNVFLDGGVTTSLTITNEIVTSIAQMIDNGDLVGTETIEVVDVLTAGAATKVTGFIVVGLDQGLAAYSDDISQVRTTVTVNPGEQFIAEGFTKVGVNAVEAVGSSRNELIASRDRHQLQVHTKQNQPFGEFFSEGYQAIQDAKWYNNAIVSFYDYEETLTVRPGYHKRAVLLWEAVPATGTTVAAAAIAIGASNPAITFTATQPDAVGIFEAWKDR